MALIQPGLRGIIHNNSESLLFTWALRDLYWTGPT